MAIPRRIVAFQKISRSPLCPIEERYRLDQASAFDIAVDYMDSVAARTNSNYDPIVLGFETNICFSDAFTKFQPIKTA